VGACGRRDGGLYRAASATVQVLDQKVAQDAGVAGVVFKVEPQGGATGKVEVGVDYKDFSEAFGGNYGSRLQVFQLPACALTTPEVAACRTRTPLKSTNNVGAREVSAQVELGAARTASLASSTSAPMVLAAATGTQSNGGTYAATDLKPSGSWVGGGSSGAFTYNYPITAPPAAGSLAPSVALSYDSGAVDGQTVSTQAQASWAGDGWSTPRSYIEQTFVSCSDKPQGKDSPKKTGDLCYAGPVLTMSLNGSTSSLVYDKVLKEWKSGTQDGETSWKAETDGGELITKVVPKTNERGAGHWEVRTRDGAKYYFGLNELPGHSTGKATTNSIDTLPVYSPHAGDPCYSADGFDKSVCTMPNRWNLDYVVDVHGNAMSYYYKQYTNYYGQNEASKYTPYTRDSHLDHIDYGFRHGGAYGIVPNKIEFGVNERCTTADCPELSESTKAQYPDVPFDLICEEGAECDSWSPSFFSTVRLDSITTRQYSTASQRHELVDSYALTQTMPATGDGTSPTLWLSSIVRKGYDKSAGAAAEIVLPSVSFESVKLPNRVNTRDGIASFYRHRVSTIETETGAKVAVRYDLPNPCTAGSEPSPASNTLSCYPVRWNPEGYTDPVVDWFNKWAVTSVTTTDQTGGAPATATSYAYLGGAAWHYDDIEVVKAKHRTYGQFRGYKTVRTFTGDGANDPRTQSDTSFYRGMSKNNNDTVVQVTDSLNGKHEDHDKLAGRTLETITYQGENGPADSSAITAYWISAATATRARSGLTAMTANWIAPALTVSKKRVTSSGSTVWNYQQVDNTYDANTESATFGTLKTSYSHSVPAEPAFDRCTTSTFAPAGAVVGLIAQTETVAVACGGFTQGAPASVPTKYNSLTPPASVSRPAQVMGQQRFFYDDATFSTTFPQTTAPTRGLLTMTQTAEAYTGGVYTYKTTAKSTYDEYGRVRKVYDGNNNLTETTYAMNAAGLPTGSTVTAPLGHTTSVTTTPARGATLTATDVNGIVTRQESDALGRVTAIWLNNRPTSAPANYKFGYTVSKTGISASTTSVANDKNNYIKTVTLYDSLLRPRQTQADTQQGGRLVTDTFYDTRGWAIASYNGWWDSGTLPTVGAPVSADDLKKQVPNQTFTTYDGLGRAVIVESAKDDVTVSKTTTVHEGDRTTVIPPAGGKVTSTTVDLLGRNKAVTEYKTRPTVTAPSNTFTGTFSLQVPADSITSEYKYDQRGHQHQTIDKNGNTWTTQYNLLGQITGKTDPTAGATTDMKYDGNGNLLQLTDSRDKTISSTFDALNRQTGTYAAETTAQSANNQLTKLVYDNSNLAMPNTAYVKGKLTTAISYSGGQEYKYQARGFDVFGNTLSEMVTIPASEGLLGGDYQVGHAYTTNNGLPLKDAYQVAKGGLPVETVLTGYDGFDQPTTLAGAAGYVQGVTYDAYGRVNQQIIGSSPNLAYITNAFDEHTGLLKEQSVVRKPTTPSNVHQQKYEYDLVGNVTRQTTNRLTTGTSETQCFGYDGLRRLTEAWTATDNCATAPTENNRSMIGNTIGAGSAYWTSWAFDDLGNRSSQIERSLSGGADTTTTYTYNGNGANQPGTLTRTETTGGRTDSTNYTYDIAGNTKTRVTASGTQTLDWNDAGKLATVTTPAGTTTNIYSHTGDLLLEKSPGRATLYVGAQQFTLNTATNTVTGTRYYALPGGGSVIRTGTGTNYTFALPGRHGTPDLYLNNTAQTPTWRQYTPYGNPRGYSINIPDNRGFLNKTLNSATGLMQIGARQYDATAGRFISVDPVFDGADPQSWNGYAYANNNPATMSDPTGLRNDANEPSYKNEQKQKTYTPPPPPPPGGGSPGGGRSGEAPPPPPKDKGWSIGGFFKGAGEQIVEVAKTPLNIAEGMWDCVTTWYNPMCVTTPGFPQMMNFGVDPGGTLEGMWEGTVGGVRDDWNDGNKDEAVGRGTIMLLELVVGPKGAGAASRAGAGSRGVPLGPVGASLRDINPKGGMQNCVRCSIATDKMLAGEKWDAPEDGGPYDISEITEYSRSVGGNTTVLPRSIEDIEKSLTRFGSGSRAIVVGNRAPGEPGHAFNAVNQGGTIRFLDGQSGGAADLEDGYTSFHAIFTDKG
jgi:RHS repeat-associated protein